MGRWSSSSATRFWTREHLHLARRRTRRRGSRRYGQNQFGVEFDGPVRIPKLYNGKDKTFFMASYEGLSPGAASNFALHPDAGGVFRWQLLGVPASSITGGAIKDPLNNTPRSLAISSPRERISPVARKLQQYYPAPNLPNLSSNFSVPVPTTAKYNQTVESYRSEYRHQIRLNVRAHWQKWDVFGGSAIPINGTTTPTTVTTTPWATFTR